MFNVQNAAEPLTTFEGKPLGGEGEEKLTLKKVLVTYLGMYQGKGVTGEDLIRAYDLGVKIYNAENSLELDDDQFRFIKKVIESAQQPMYTALVMGQVLKKLEESKVVVEPATKVVEES